MKTLSPLRRAYFAVCFSSALAATALLLLLVPSSAHALRFAVFVVPFYGHTAPLLAIAEQLVLRGHDVTVFAERREWWVSSARRPGSMPDATQDEAGIHLVGVPNSNTFDMKVFEQLSAGDEVVDVSFPVLFAELTRHQEQQLPAIYKIALKEHTEDKQRGPFSGVLYDVSTFVGSDIAHALNLPRVAVFPLVLTLATNGVLPTIPHHGSGFSRNMSLVERQITSLVNWLTVAVGALPVLSAVHNNRRTAGITQVYHDFNDLGTFYDPVIAPTIWGYDVAAPVCPHIKPVGILEMLPSPFPIEPDLEQLLKSPACAAEGVDRVYINFGTLSVMDKVMLAKMTEAVRVLLQGNATAGIKPACVVWKLRAKDEIESVTARRTLPDFQNSDLLYVRQRFNDPQKILPLVTVFVSHCGDTSVGEALNKLTPVAGIPFFADQIDVCTRLQERGFGVLIGRKHTFTPELVVEKVRSVGVTNPTKRASVERALRETRDVARWLGGAPEAARWIEVIVAKNISRAFHCRHLNHNAMRHEMERTWWSDFQMTTLTGLSGYWRQIVFQLDLDITVAYGVILVIGFWQIASWLLRVVGRLVYRLLGWTAKEK